MDYTLLQSVEWMWGQQSADGGWHSQTHAVLRDGKVLTPYILFHLLQVQEEIFVPSPASVESAVSFIVNEMRSSINDDNTGLVDYPNYNAAYALRLLHLLERDTPVQKIIIRYLLDQQFTERRGFTPDSLVYGGWGYGEPGLGSGMHGHVDISHTRRVAEALFENNLLSDSQKAGLKEKVIIFMRGVQRSQDDKRLYAGCISRSSLPYDGGFISSTVTLPTNKSQPLEIKTAGVHYPSYATATCDGFMTMHALEMKGLSSYNDASVWLTENKNISSIDGLSKEDPDQWSEIMHYYHLGVRSEVMKLIDPVGAWKESVREILIREQLSDGSFINPLGGVNKEDDPLMATIFAIQAATNVRG